MARLPIVDVREAREYVAREVKECIEKVAETIIATLKKNEGAVGEGDVRGLRDQIMANAIFLAPRMSAGRDTAFDFNNAVGMQPEIHLLTLGREPHIRAYILIGHTDSAKKFLSSDAAKSSTLALKLLLKMTERLLEGHIEGITKPTTTKRTQVTARAPAIITHGPAIAKSKHARMNTDDLRYWGSESVHNHGFHQNGSFDGKLGNGDDSGFESDDDRHHQFNRSFNGVGGDTTAINTTIHPAMNAHVDRTFW